MSWSINVAAHDPQDDRPLLERVAAAIEASPCPAHLHFQLISWTQEAIASAEAGLDQNFSCYGHLNADGTGSYSFGTSLLQPATLASPPPSPPAAVEGDALGLADMEIEP